MKLRLMQKLVKGGHWLRLALALWAISLMPGCSFFIITDLAQKHDDDLRGSVLDSVRIGASRSQIIDKLGQPASSESAGGKLVDTYDLRLLPPGAYTPGGTCPGQLVVLSDMASLGGLEVLAALWAIHDVHSKSQLCRFTLTYGPGDQVEKVEDSTNDCVGTLVTPGIGAAAR